VDLKVHECKGWRHYLFLLEGMKKIKFTIVKGGCFCWEHEGGYTVHKVYMSAFVGD
jgi:hypothetical protein